MLNTLNASPDTVFSDDVLLGYLPVLAEQSSGPRFTVTRPTVLAHVGAFVNPYPDNYTARTRPRSRSRSVGPTAPACPRPASRCRSRP
jgi:hypothetical protein